MQQRLSLITLAVADLAVTRAFYIKLGWQPAQEMDDTVFFQLNGVALSLYPRAKLAEDAHVPPHGNGFRGITLAYNVNSEAEVEAILKVAEAAGGKMVKPAQKVFWGGYSGYFADPDGQLWEVAYNPFAKLDDHGNFWFNA